MSFQLPGRLVVLSVAALLVVASPAQALPSLADLGEVLGDVWDGLLGVKEAKESVDPAVPGSAVQGTPVPARAVPVDPEVPPVAAFACSSSLGGLMVHLRDLSSHAAGSILIWEWDFGDGLTQVVQTRSANPTGHSYAEPGTYLVSLTVKDQQGRSATVSETCSALVVPDFLVGVRVGSSPSGEPDPEAALASYCRESGVPLVPPPALVSVTGPLAPVEADDPCAASVASSPMPPRTAVGFESARVVVIDTGAKRTPIPAAGPPLSKDPAYPQAPLAATTMAVLPASSPEGNALMVTALGATALVAATPHLALYRPWRRLLALLPTAFLFTRVKDEELLDHPVRLQIVQTVEAEPGIHYQALVRALEKGNGVLEHHLRLLTHAGMLRQRTAGGYTCYFPQHTDRRMMDVQGVLKADVARDALTHIMSRPGVAVGEVATALGVTPKAIRYHLRRFEDVGLVRMEKQGRSVQLYAETLALQVPAAAS